MKQALNPEAKAALAAGAKEKSAGKQLFLAEYSFLRRDGGTEYLCFVFREPSTAEMQLYSEQAQRDSMGANEQLLGQLAVAAGDDEGGKTLLEQIGPHTAAVGTFVQEYLNPLFGRPLEHKPLVAI